VRVATEAVEARGLPLVEQVIAAHAQGLTRLPTHPGLLGGASARPRRYLGGRTLPPSLARWLEVDDGWLDGLADPPVRLAALVERVFGPGSGDAFRTPPLARLDALCARLPGVGTDSVRFLYLGPVDVHGEYAVLQARLGDPAEVSLWSPGFDAWLAEEAGMIEVDRWEGEGLEARPAWRVPMQRAAARVLDGALRWSSDQAPQADRSAWPGQDVD
jgi:hypothetical protein